MCYFTGTGVVGYGDNYINNSKKIASRSYTLSDGSSTEGVSCLSAEFGAIYQLYGSCYILIDPEAELDADLSTSTSEDNKTVTVLFAVKETQVGTIADLKSKIRVKRTDETDFHELGPEDTVSNVTSATPGFFLIETSNLHITFKDPLMGTDNQLLIEAGALVSGQGTVFDRPIVIDVMENDLGSWELVGNRGLSTGMSMGGLGMAVLDGTPYMAYIDSAYSYKLFVKKYNGNNWVSVDSGGLSAGYTSAFTMISSGGSLYLTYYDFSDSKLYIKKYDGSNWSSLDVGSNVQIPLDGKGLFSLAVYNNKPYIAYSDKANGNRLTVKSYNGNDWDLLGVSGFSQDPVSHISLVISKGIPYVAYRNEFPFFVRGLGWTFAPSGWAKKFDQASNSWSDLGKFSNDNPEMTKLLVKDDIPYVAYHDIVSGVTGTKVAVKKLEASGDWSIVDGYGSISNESDYSFYAFEGTFYVTYIAKGKTVVKKLVGSQWVSVGNSGITEMGATYTSLYVDNEVPYLATSSPSFSNNGISSFRPDVYKFQLNTPALTADLTNYNTVSPVVVTFPDSAAWRSAITAVKDGTVTLAPETYTISAGKITFNTGTLGLGSHSITISAPPHYKEAKVDLTVFLKKPTVTADTLQNDVGHPIELSFPDDAVWRDAITEIKDGTTAITDYTIIPGKIIFPEGVLAEGNHTLTITATNYSDIIVDQQVTLIPSPALTADTTDNSAANPLEITFPDDEAWRDAITAVKDGTTTLPLSKYSIDAGKITFKAGVLTLGDHAISVFAERYANATVTQRVGMKPPTITANTTNNDAASMIEVSFPDDPAWRGAITAIKNGTTTLSAGAYTVASGKITFNAGVLSTGSHTLTIEAFNYADVTFQQDILTGLMELSNLSLSGGLLQFNAATINYSLSVASHVASVTVTPTAANTTAIVTVAANSGAGERVISGQSSSVIPLHAGLNIITVVVTSQDGLTSKTYTIEVYKVSDDALLSNITVDQVSLTFVPSILEYSIDVPNAAESLGFSVTKANTKQMLAVTGADEISVTGSVYTYSATHLAVGTNVIEIHVMAQDGLTVIPYRLLVNRALAVSGNADLKSITLSNGTLTPTFAAGTTEYTSRVDYAIDNLTLTASLDDTKATMTIKGVPTSNGQPSSSIGLNVGANLVPIIVTAENGTSKTYWVTITRNAQAELPGGGGTGGSGGGAAEPVSTPVTSNNGQLTIPKDKSGEVSLQNEVKVFIPEDASSQAIHIQIEKLLDTQHLVSAKEVLVSPIFEILKNFSDNFNLPVTLTFAFDPASLTGNQKPVVFYYDELKKVWVKVGGVVNGTQIVVEVDHFTKFAVFAVSDSPEVPTAVNISDISGHWAEANIKQAVSEGIVTGYPNGTFKPNHSITRAEFVVMLANAFKLQGNEAELTFADSSKIGTWARKAVSLAVQEGIISGYEDGSFRPNAAITREEMAVMIAKALGKSSDANAVIGFADERDIALWARGSVAYVKEAGIVNGKGDNRFAPQDHTTRAEAVAVLLRARD
ncbi:hemoblobin-interacting domain-containing protein [Paenibacillus sinopodophylli]|uniref:hemoblobin-interacting domain-containing protein n=1 Tax=Paenibacillus sinopodophylli TaxID=1837342 RepID=UPI001485DEF1|nr:S-layer homology domain-containing protein [Paenibacillus sinopodophylli]